MSSAPSPSPRDAKHASCQNTPDSTQGSPPGSGNRLRCWPIEYWQAGCCGAGTALATFGLLFLPWAFASAFFGRFMFIRSLEMVVFRLAIVFLIILFGRWAIVVLMDLMGWM